MQPTYFLWGPFCLELVDISWVREGHHLGVVVNTGRGNDEESQDALEKVQCCSNFYIYIYIYMYFKIISIYIYIKYHMPSYACIVLIYIYSLHRLKCKIILWTKKLWNIQSHIFRRLHHSLSIYTYMYMLTLSNPAKSQGPRKVSTHWAIRVATSRSPQGSARPTENVTVVFHWQLLLLWTRKSWFMLVQLVQPLTKKNKKKLANPKELHVKVLRPRPQPCLCHGRGWCPPGRKSPRDGSTDLREMDVGIFGALTHE